MFGIYFTSDKNINISIYMEVFFIKKAQLFLCLFISISFFIFAHTPLLLVEDNGDGTVYAEAGFSDGSGAKGLACRLEDESGKVLWEGKFDEFNSIEIEIPDVSPYFIVFDAGPGHIVKKEGPSRPGNVEKEIPETGKTDIPDRTTDENSGGVTGPAGVPVQTQAAVVSQPLQSVNWLPQSTYFGNSSTDGNGNHNEIINTVFLAIITVLLAVIAVSLLIIAVAMVNRKN